MRYRFLFIAIVCASEATAQAIGGGPNALSVQTRQAIKVVVDVLSEEATKFVLQRERIQKRCELRLGQTDIQVDNDVVEPYLYVKADIAGSAFNVQVSFF